MDSKAREYHEQVLSMAETLHQKASQLEAGAKMIGNISNEDAESINLCEEDKEKFERKMREASVQMKMAKSKILEAGKILDEDFEPAPDPHAMLMTMVSQLMDGARQDREGNEPWKGEE